MKICDEKVKKEAPELIMGHLYQHEDGDIYICAYGNRLVCLGDGLGWYGDKGFDDHGHKFTDVTDLYYLKRIEG